MLPQTTTTDANGHHINNVTDFELSDSLENVGQSNLDDEDEGE